MRGQDTHWVARILGLVVEASRKDAQLLEDAVDAEHVGDRKSQDTETRQGLRDGDNLVDPARRRHVAQAQGGDGYTAEVQRFQERGGEPRNLKREASLQHTFVIDAGVAPGDE
jgi:hypothetical protein